MKYMLCVALGYLIGSFSTAIVLSIRRKNQDIRTLGSGNAGATNMYRAFGWHAGLFTMVCDIAKGMVATCVGLFLLGRAGGAIAGAAAVVGHTYPIYYGFKGGKGITVSLGMTFVLAPYVACAVILPSLLIIYFTRIMSLGTLIGNLAIVTLTWCFYSGERLVCMLMTLVFLLNLFSHRENIRRLLKGKENKLQW